MATIIAFYSTRNSTQACAYHRVHEHLSSSASKNNTKRYHYKETQLQHSDSITVSNGNVDIEIEEIVYAENLRL